MIIGMEGNDVSREFIEKRKERETMRRCSCSILLLRYGLRYERLGRKVLLASIISMHS